MKALLVPILFISILVNNSIYAETSKTTDTNKTMSNDEFMKKFMAIEQRKKDAIKKGETLDEINKLLGVDKQK